MTSEECPKEKFPGRKCPAWNDQESGVRKLCLSSQDPLEFCLRESNSLHNHSEKAFRHIFNRNYVSRSEIVCKELRVLKV